MKTSIAIAVLLLLAAAPRLSANDSNMMLLLQQRVLERLKDPDSAQFRNLYLTKKRGGVGLCGEVNAKNGFGGYTGYRPFVANGKFAAFEDDIEAGGFIEIWNELCTR